MSEAVRLLQLGMSTKWVAWFYGVSVYEFNKCLEQWFIEEECPFCQ